VVYEEGQGQHDTTVSR